MIKLNFKKLCNISLRKQTAKQEGNDKRQLHNFSPEFFRTYVVTIRHNITARLENRFSFKTDNS